MWATRYGENLKTPGAAIHGPKVMLIDETAGSGGEAWRPLGLAIVGGLLVSQLITLYLTPVVYTYMAQFQTWLHPKAAAQLEPAVAGK